MKDGIRKKGDRRKEGKKEKKEGDDLHPGKGKREEWQHAVKRPDFACTAFLARREEIIRIDVISLLVA